MDDFGELIKEFLVESGENLDRLDQDFLALEKDPTAREQLKSIFRTIHTIKGTCGFFGFAKLESIAHVGESLLGRLQEGHIEVSAEVITALLQMVDVIRAILRQIEFDGTEGASDAAPILAELTRLNAGASSCAPLPPLPPLATDVFAIEDAPPHPPAVHVERTEPADGDAHGGAAAGGIRVDVGLLDRLMNLVGELVLARNQILQFASAREDAALAGTTQRLNLITTELQEGVMKTRMQPIGNVWSKFPRIVRDLAKMCGKEVRVEMTGRETELDKTIIEAIKDPLTHIIRNSVDHGIEPADRRLAGGKPAEGCLWLTAFHEGGQVNIEIRDDGGGIATERVKAKAVEKGLISAEQAARMGEREAISLIFLPGFSTAAKVTNVSGRGVGMDVVKTNIEKIGGTVDVQSILGVGTTLRIKIPLTLAIIPALLITSGGERYAIPQVSLLELVRLDEKSAGIEAINGTPLYRLRGNLLPVLHLNRELRLDAPPRPASAASNMVVLRGGDDRQFGLVVDDINDTEEIVVKPLSKQLKAIGVLSGATIMGDGKVALILDVMGLAQRASLFSAAASAAQQAGKMSKPDDASDRRVLLLFDVEGDDGVAGRMAIPLSQVARLEEFAWSAVEHAGTECVVQYRGQIMPLVHVAGALAARRRAGERLRRRAGRPRRVTDKIQVVVHSGGARNVGLHVERIVDVAEERVDLQTAGARPGVLGTAVIKGRVTELLDIESFIHNADATDAAAAARAA